MHFEITPEFLASQGLSPTFVERFWAKVDKNGPIPEHMPHLGKCWVWTARKDKGGYGTISGCTENKCVRAHVCSWIIHSGPVPVGLHVHHHCDNPSCIRISHLWVGTPKENVDDMMKKGRFVIGKRLKHENHLKAKITWKDVKQIRALCSKGCLQNKVAKRFGISPSNVSAIVLFEIWRRKNSPPKKRPGRRKGEQAVASKLTESQVLEIRKRYVVGNRWNMLGTTNKLAREFGVSAYHIRAIANRWCWNHIP